nr:hypothetical protein Itr_chr11CG20750 [Ipomoea trifida]
MPKMLLKIRNLAAGIQVDDLDPAYSGQVSSALGFLPPGAPQDLPRLVRRESRISTFNLKNTITA